ncbi:NAD(+) synthase [Virgibacillus siamensis]|uniref:NAD(+) synthase n=1 Tax=Virgibacillus siamensis TaxID=480071 RepID=UPI000985D6F9|nr:NAD(+) synthase [Virgibacillus siamensis]
MKQNVEAIVKWLQEQIHETGVKGLLVGVSGGLDSAVVAHLIKCAAPDHSLGVIMPLKSSRESLDHSQKVVESCGISHMTIDLEETHNVLYSTVKEQLKAKNEFQEKNAQLADANLRARLRMSTLYTLATNYNYLVVGTDNASEWYTGYFTKYGDGGVDILPIVEFTKQEIREMAAYLGVPADVVNKKPSADLWDGQTDEDEMGTSYDRIDAYLEGETIPEQDKEIIERMHKRTEHKRHGAKQFRFRNK